MKLARTGGRPVPDGDVEAVVGYIERKGGTHGAKADQANFGFFHGACTPVLFKVII